MAGGFAVNAMTGSSDGGADSPEAAVREFFDAVNDEDVLGAIDVVLPGERRTFKDPLVRFVEQLQRLDVLGDDADLAKIGGVDLQVTLDDVQVEPITDDIAIGRGRRHGCSVRRRRAAPDRRPAPRPCPRRTAPRQHDR